MLLNLAPDALVGAPMIGGGKESPTWRPRTSPEAPKSWGPHQEATAKPQLSHNAATFGPRTAQGEDYRRG